MLHHIFSLLMLLLVLPGWRVAKGVASRPRIVDIDVSVSSYVVRQYQYQSHQAGHGSAQWGPSYAISRDNGGRRSKIEKATLNQGQQEYTCKI